MLVRRPNAMSKSVGSELIDGKSQCFFLKQLQLEAQEQGQAIMTLFRTSQVLVILTALSSLKRVAWALISDVVRHVCSQLGSDDLLNTNRTINKTGDNTRKTD